MTLDSETFKECAFRPVANAHYKASGIDAAAFAGVSPRREPEGLRELIHS